MNYDDLIGIPFAYGGRGRESFDCYGLILELHKRMGVSIPDYQSPTNQTVIAGLMACQLHLWKRVEDYTPYSVLLLRVGYTHSHVGMYLGDNKFIHTFEKSGGVCVERLSDWTNRIEGFYKYAKN